MNTQTNQLWQVIGLAATLALAAAACGGNDLACGPGSTERDGRCVANVASCGPGTVLRDGICEPDCGENEYWNGAKCTTVRQCGPGTVLSGDTCIPQCVGDTYWNGQACANVPTCADGTSFDADAGACAPTDALCAAGTHFEAGKCVPDAETCAAGTHLDNGACVPDTLPAPDVTESSDPQGESAFDLPASGESLILGGTVDTPIDLDGDGIVDPDYDTFTFTAEAGTWLRLHATSAGAAHPAFVIVSQAQDADGYPLYTRYGLDPLGLDTQREIYLPRAGNYAILVSDYNHVVADIYGWAMLPVGGDDYTYQVVVENLGDPTPTPIADPTFADSGSVADGALHFYLLKGLAQHDVRMLTNAGVAPGHVYSDVFAALMLFDPAGALLREVVASSTDEDASALFAATSAGDHLVVVDHLMTIGDRLDYALSVAPVTPADCGVASCASGSFAASEQKLLRWDLSAGDLFAVGLSLPSTASTTLDVRFLDEGLLPLAATSSATKYGPAKELYYARKSEAVYLHVLEHTGTAVASYTLDARTTATPALSSGSTSTGLAVVQMPADTYEDAGYAHFVGTAGKVVVSTGLAVSGPNWTSPVEEYLSPDFDVLGPALDVTSSSFPNSTLAPLLAYVPVAGHCLQRVRDGAGGDIASETWDTTFHALDPADLGTPTLSQPASLADRSLDTGAGLAVLRFMAAPGPKATVTVTPHSGTVLQPEVMVATPGASVYSSGTYNWAPDAASYRVGVVARAAATAAAEPASVQLTPSYDGIHLVIVRDVAGMAASADLFDIDVALSN